ncbi:hypothetical protein [Sphingomonas leidyi]|uniref:hypothetical protein n=2 Tax=Sphingomonadaceae TaxID=41297 RepID=UPI0026D0F0C1
MMCAFVPLPARSSHATSLLLDAARCWRRARDAGPRVQPTLYAQLERHGCGIMAPVFDGLFIATEAGLGRPLELGADGEATITSDEIALLTVLDQPPMRSQSDVSVRSWLAAAQDSAAIMLRSVLDATSTFSPERRGTLNRKSSADHHHL